MSGIFRWTTDGIRFAGTGEGSISVHAYQTNIRKNPALMIEESGTTGHVLAYFKSDEDARRFCKALTLKITEHGD